MSTVRIPDPECSDCDGTGFAPDPTAFPLAGNAPCSCLVLVSREVASNNVTRGGYQSWHDLYHNGPHHNEPSAVVSCKKRRKDGVREALSRVLLRFDCHTARDIGLNTDDTRELLDALHNLRRAVVNGDLTL